MLGFTVESCYAAIGVVQHDHFPARAEVSAVGLGALAQHLELEQGFERAAAADVTNRRFSDLATLTGAPRTLLTTRLRKLEESGVIVMQQYCERTPRFEYFFTPAGVDLIPVILTLEDRGGSGTPVRGHPRRCFRGLLTGHTFRHRS
ncbi:winged helix-turn-helix transcriptional regulator [Actinomycetes bacterium M1A6_2h]